MSTEPLLTAIDDRGVATVTLNRPELHNAFDDAQVARLTEAFPRLGADPAVRAVKLAGNGKSFSAGADLNWMRRMAGLDEQGNLEDTLRLATMFETLNTLPKPTVARIQGSAFAGGAGLVACCDIAVAVPEARFAITEVRLGLVPGAIGPYVLPVIGARAARRHVLTGERFSAARARELGLVHEVATAAELDAAVDGIVADLLLGGPEAMRHCKRLVRRVGGGVSPEIQRESAGWIAERRVSAEGQEGLAAFLEKRKPAWVAGT